MYVTQVCVNIFSQTHCRSVMSCQSQSKGSGASMGGPRSLPPSHPSHHAALLQTRGQELGPTFTNKLAKYAYMQTSLCLFILFLNSTKHDPRPFQNNSDPTLALFLTSPSTSFSHFPSSVFLLPIIIFMSSLSFSCVNFSFSRL